MTSYSRVPDDPKMSQEMRDFLDSLARVPNNNYEATAAPGVGDDAKHGYSVGSSWINVTADDAYVCLDSTTGAAVWKKVTP